VLTRIRQGLTSLRNFFSHGVGLVLFVAASVLFPCYAVWCANSIAFDSVERTVALWDSRPKVLLYGVVLVGALYWVVNLLTRRIWAGALVTGFLCILFPAIDYFKMQILGEHFYPWDLFLSGEAGSFATFLQGLEFPEIMLNSIWQLLLWTLVLWLMGVKLPGSWKIRVPGGVLLGAATFALVYSNAIRNTLYEPLFDLTVNYMADQYSNYNQNGFVAAFGLSIGSLNVQPPEGYSQQTMENLDAEYGQEYQTGEFQRPDVVVVLSEAFWDPTTLQDLEFSQDPLPNYRAIAEDNPHGSFVSITIGGGTIRPEFEMLTGGTLSMLPPGTMPYQQYLRGDTWSYARMFQDLGYDTVGIHTYLPEFYGRNQAYPYMGFDEFRGQDDLHVPVEYGDGPYINDATFVDELIYELEQPHEDGLFLFGISMENHATYWGKYPEGSEYPVEVTGGGLGEDLLGNVESLCKGLYGADAALGELYEYVQQREKPTVVLWFGDHLPAIGYAYEPFVSQWGISTEGASQWTEQQKYQMLSTPFVVFSNYDTGVEFPGDGQATSPAFLMNQLCDYMAAPSDSYRNFLRSFWQVCPVYNTEYGLFTQGVEVQERNELRDIQWMYTYDRLLGKRYSMPAS
jgi:phosphoglycerol transferase MdoB-like AlkP superfamily enzyme